MLQESCYAVDYCIIIMQFEINCTATNSDYYTWYVISLGNGMHLGVIKE